MNAIAAILTVAVALPAMSQERPKAADGWPMHSTDRPQPRVVRPAPAAQPLAPPADAVVLFDGSSLAHWRTTDSVPAAAKWRVIDGAMEVVRGGGAVQSVQEFGSVQLHVEWRAPAPPNGSGQNRGNSGVFLMGRYEVQVLDSYDNVTYPDGQAGAVYGQYAPLVNASRPPGEWQAFDIVFHAPRFDTQGAVTSPARMTVFHNGVLVQDDVSLLGPTSNQRRDPYVAHPDRLPIMLQDHGDPVRYRNIWVRELKP